jgi:UDP-4-amino-4-deoxy-L-arabinose formyltransferase / UDP-glucuronic acid dehydrogenase (UDP-4-keto-hexauronic acid decarboxylating)
MKGKKILFMGGKYVGYECLSFLLGKKYNVVGCYVNTNDISKDRWYPSVTELCLKHQIPVFYFEDINAKLSEKNIRRISPDIIVVVYYDQILKANIINTPKVGCINLHLSLSQVHRGCYPTTWSLIRGDKHTGATLHFITQKIDEGPVIAQKKIRIKKDWTGEDLYYQVSDHGVKLFRETFPLLDKIKPYALDYTNSVYYKREFPCREIVLDEKTINKVKALSFEPFPKPYIMIGKRKFIFEEVKD